jgi:hypothetical protein
MAKLLVNLIISHMLTLCCYRDKIPDSVDVVSLSVQS